MQIHRASRRLHTSAVEDLGLRAALESEAEEFAVQTGIGVQSDLSFGERTEVRPQLAAGLFRIAQEGLRNVRKHSCATRVQVTLAQRNGELELSIQDDGVGFDPAEARKRLGLGLASMNERATLLGGTLTIESEAGGGTRLVARVPLETTQPCSEPAY